MAVFLLKIIFLALTTLSSIISRLIFTVTGYLIVLTIHAFKVPGQAIQGGLEQVANFIKVCFEYVLEQVMEVISSLISSAFDLVKDGVSGSAAAMATAIAGLMDAARTSLAGLLEDLPKVLEGFLEMISTMVMDLWNNCMEAAGYVTENA